MDIFGGFGLRALIHPTAKKTMKIKSLKKIIEALNRNEGVSLIAIITLLVIMSVMGGVFSSVMGRWKVSAPTTMNSNKALYLAETAAMFALQDAQYRFYSKDASGNDMFNFGTDNSPYVVSSSSTEEADYWFERPDLVDDDGSSDDDGSDDDADDANSADDLDGDGNSDLYTIIATGKIKRDGTTVAKRQIKIKATIIDNSSAGPAPGVHTDGNIEGTGPPNNAHFDMDNPDTGANVTYGNGTNNVTTGSETGPPAIVYRPAQPLDENVFKALATDQGHYYSGDFSVSDNYPNGSFYYSGSVPNIIFVEGNLTLNGNREIYGVYWIKGNTTVFNDNYRVNGIIICEGDLTMNGGGNKSPNLNGGIIQYGASSTLTGNGQPTDIDINETYFEDMNNTLPIVTVVSSQEAVSAN